MARASLLGLGAIKTRPTAERIHDENLEVKMPVSSATIHARTTIRRLPRRAGLAAFFVGLALLLTACGGGASGSASDPAKDPPRKAEDATGSTPNSTTTTTQKAGTVDGETTAAAEVASPKRATARYLVSTITCPSCVARVEANAEKEPGVIDAKADLATQEATVTYDPKKTDPKKIADAIREGGDTVKPLESG